MCVGSEFENTPNVKHFNTVWNFDNELVSDRICRKVAVCNRVQIITIKIMKISSQFCSQYIATTKTAATKIHNCVRAEKSHK